MKRIQINRLVIFYFSIVLSPVLLQGQDGEYVQCEYPKEGLGQIVWRFGKDYFKSIRYSASTNESIVFELMFQQGVNPNYVTKIIIKEMKKYEFTKKCNWSKNAKKGANDEYSVKIILYLNTWKMRAAPRPSAEHFLNAYFIIEKREKNANDNLQINRLGKEIVIKFEGVDSKINELKFIIEKSLCEEVVANSGQLKVTLKKENQYIKSIIKTPFREIFQYTFAGRKYILTLPQVGYELIGLQGLPRDASLGYFLLLNGKINSEMLIRNNEQNSKFWLAEKNATSNQLLKLLLHNQDKNLYFSYRNDYPPYQLDTQKLKHNGRAIELKFNPITSIFKFDSEALAKSFADINNITFTNGNTIQWNATIDFLKNNPEIGEINRGDNFFEVIVKDQKEIEFAMKFSLPRDKTAYFDSSVGFGATENTGIVEAKKKAKLGFEQFFTFIDELVEGKRTIAIARKQVIFANNSPQFLIDALGDQSPGALAEFNPENLREQLEKHWISNCKLEITDKLVKLIFTPGDAHFRLPPYNEKNNYWTTFRNQSKGSSLRALNLEWSDNHHAFVAKGLRASPFKIPTDLKDFTIAKGENCKSASACFDVLPKRKIKVNVQFFVQNFLSSDPTSFPLHENWKLVDEKGKPVAYHSVGDQLEFEFQPSASMVETLYEYTITDTDNTMNGEVREVTSRGNGYNMKVALRNRNDRILIIYYPLQFRTSYRNHVLSNKGDTPASRVNAAFRYMDSQLADLIQQLKGMEAGYEKIYLRYAGTKRVEVGDSFNSRNRILFGNEEKYLTDDYNWSSTAFAGDYEKEIKATTTYVDVLYFASVGFPSTVKSKFKGTNNVRICLLNFLNEKENRLFQENPPKLESLHYKTVLIKDMLEQQEFLTIEKLKDFIGDTHK